MAKSTIKLRTKEKKGLIQVKSLISHPMHTGLVRDKNGDKIPAHFINEVIVEANGEIIMTANWTGAISKNPFISLNYAGAKGDMVKLSWKDNNGESDSLEKTVK